jgi:hypothetical protein
MSIIDLQLVKIEIVPIDDRGRSSGLRLNYQGQIYDLVQAFASNKRDRAEQKLWQLQEIEGHVTDRYLLVREVGYYSLWKIALEQLRLQTGSSLTARSSDRQAESQGEIALELQQASIWLFQELWLQWQDLLGARQLQVFADSLLAVTPQLQSWVDLDRLLSLDPIATVKLESWSEKDFTAFDRQLYQLAQKKMGQQFGTKLTLDIIETMPDPLRSTLVNILGI